MIKQKRNIYKPNKYERKILITIFLYATIPMFVVILLFFGLFSDLIYTYIGSGLAEHFINRLLILVVLIFFYYLIFSRMVFRFTNRLAGAYQRLLGELDKIITGTATHHLHLRKDDYGQELIDRINKLIDKLS
jgi:CBS domain containing-hemolysin-like protein